MAPGKWAVISIRDAGATDAPVDAVRDLAVDVLVLIFDDVWNMKHEQMGFTLATEGQIRQALEFAKGKDAVLVHCHAGVSRSSAVAFIVACQEMDPSEAIKLIDFNLHFPNEHIVKIGASILGDDRVFEAFLSKFGKG